MRIRIRVTSSDIHHGHRDDCWGCPIALSAWRALLALSVQVFVDDLRIVMADDLRRFGERIEHIIALPHSARQFLEAFDAGQPVAPFDFTIEVPCENTHEPHVV